MTRDETIAEVRKLRAEGLTIRQIEKRIGGPSRMTVWRWINGRRDGPGVEKPCSSKGQPMNIPKVEGGGPTYPDVDPEDKDALIARLQLENDILRGVNEVLKGASLGKMTNSQKTSVVDYLRRTTSRPLKELIVSLKISKSSYEYQRRAQARPDKYAELRALVKSVFQNEGRSCRGYRFVVRELRRRQEPVRASEKVVRRIMREEGLAPCWMEKRRKPYSSYVGEVSKAPENLVKRNFKSALPNFLWLTDITEFKLPCGFKVYLSAIKDCFDSSIVSWRIGRHPDSELANGTLKDACSKLKEGERPVIHSDRGGHYRWPGWIGVCKRHSLVRSMSAKGCTPDNAAMEGFFGLLKKEFFHGRDWSGVDSEGFVEELNGWIDGYNRKRKCAALGHVTPSEFRSSLGKAV